MISILKRVTTRVGSLTGLAFLLLALVIALKTDAPQAIGGQSLVTLPSKVDEELGPIQIGEIETVDLKIEYLNEASWTQTIHYPGAAYIKVHFLALDLVPGDYVTVSDPTGTEVYTYPGSDYTTDGSEGFWAISIVSDTAVIELHSGEEDGPSAESEYYEKALAGAALHELGVVIDKYARGYPPEEILERIERTESTCGANQRTDVVCYQSSHPTEYTRSHAVARLLINSTYLCTGWRASSQNRVFTNEHCVTSQSDVNGTEVWFNYQRLTCGSGDAATPTIVTGNTLLTDDYTLDFALFTVNSFSSISSFGYLELDVRTPVLDEEIYIPQHGAGNPKEFGIESDMNTGNVCRIDDAIADGRGSNTDTGYYCDTTGGSSGSPVLARSSHQVIGLHHWGTGGAPCDSSTMNQGVRIDQIWPLVASYFDGGGDPTGDIVINELDLGSSDAVELYNADSQAINMTGWNFIAYSSGGSVDVDYTFPSFTLQPGAYVVLHETGGTNTAADLYLSDNISWINGGSGAAALIGSNGSGVDFVRFGSSSVSPPAGINWTGSNPAGPPSGQTLGRDSASTDTDDGSDWCSQTPTLGAQNLGCGGNVGPVVYDNHTVDDDASGGSDGNNDGIVNCGETIELLVDLYNQGNDTATGVGAVLSTSDSYISIIDSQENYPDIPGGATRTCVYDFDFEVDPNTPNGHVIHFDLDITASNGGPWTDSFDVPVVCSGGGQAQWTFMIYLAGDNNLEGAGIDDFLEMSSVGSTSDVNIVVQFDRIPGYDSGYDDWTSTKRFWVTPGMTPASDNALQDIGEVNMGDPQTLIDFVQWGMSSYPADHYAVVLWDHGSGWRLRPDEKPFLKDVAYDDTSGGDALDMPELLSAMDTLSNGGSEPLDLVGFDACLMGMIEVDNQLIPYVDVRVGSEETEPWDGWPFDTILSSLTGNPAMSASQLGLVIVDEYYASYSNSETQSAIDLHTPYDTLNTAVNDFAVALINGVSSHHAEIATARANTQKFYYPTYIDLYDFAYQVNQEVSDATINAAATDVMNAVNGAVIREQHGGSWPGAHGISIYFPESEGAYDSDYDGSTGWLQFTANTQWDEWLHAFYDVVCLDCSSAVTADCGGSYGDDTTGSPSNVDYYGCGGWYESGPEDVYVITTSSTGYIRASFSDMEPGVDLDVFILSDCNEGACEAYGNNEAIYADAPPGTYYIVVDGYYGDAGSYMLDIACGGSTCNDPHEPNDTPEEATSITYSTTLSDPDICPAGDVDYYAFTGNAGDIIVADIDARAIGSALDSYLYLYDTDGVTELTHNDDYDGLDSRIIYTLPADGTYYLMVREFSHPNEGGPDYFYTISLTKGEAFDVEANWTSSAPTIDGQIASGEWDNAATFDITNPRTLQKQKQDDLAILNLPETVLWEKEPSQISLEPKDRLAPVILYVMNDGSHLYLAIDNPNDTTTDTYDQMGVYFDDNPLPSDGQWTNTSCGHPDGEGNFWALLSSVDYREWIAGPDTCDVVSPAPGASGAVGYDSGHTQIEIAIDLISSALRAAPGETINMYLWIYDANTGSMDGKWPITADFRDPATYGQLRLEVAPAPPAITSITPNSGHNNEVVHITNLAGSNFQTVGTTTAKLIKAGETDINATNVTVVNASQITCDFNLRGASPGKWTVRVTNPDTQYAELANGFTVKGFVYLPIILKNYH